MCLTNYYPTKELYEFDPIDISASIYNLARLGLIEITSIYLTDNNEYVEFYTDENYYQKILLECKSLYIGEEFNDYNVFLVKHSLDRRLSELIFIKLVV